MKTIIRSLTVVSVLFSFMLALSLFTDSVYAQDAVNNNGSFELSDVTVSGDTTSVEGWEFFIEDGAASRFEIVDNPVQDGNRALSVTVEGLGDNDWSIGAVNENIQVEPNTTYSYSVWARSNQNGTTANFTVGDYDFQELGRIDNSEVSLTSEWQEFTFQFTTGSSHTEIRAPIHFNFSANLEGSGGGGPPGGGGGRPNSVDGDYEVASTSNSIHIDNLRIFIQEAEPPPHTAPMADGHSKFVGNIYAPSQLQHFEFYWNQVTAENAGKWGHVEPVRGEYNWSALDASYDLAKDNGWPYRFHVLTWGGQQPDWINDLSTEEQLVAITEWYDAVADRYPDLDYVEVVNEGCCGHQLPDGQSGDADYIDALGGTGETGFDWIITAFEMARERFPNSKLMINDYNIVSSVTWGTQNANEYKAIIDELVDRDLIDVIGVQAHAFSTVGTPEEMTAVLDLLAETGLPIQATEMDIQGQSSSPNADLDAIQLENMQRIFPTFWEHPAVEGITFWGWRPGLWMEDAELVWEDGEERPALVWLRDYLADSDPGDDPPDDPEDPVACEVAWDSEATYCQGDVVSYNGQNWEWTHGRCGNNTPGTNPPRWTSLGECSNSSNKSVSSDEVEVAPAVFSLSQSYPNPFNPTTLINYEIAETSEVRLRVYDIHGRLVQTLVNEVQAPGQYEVTFDAGRLASGTYIYRIEAGSFVSTRQMMLIK